MSLRGTDRTYLTTSAYRDSGKLRARRSIYQFRTAPGSLALAVLAVVDWPVGCRVLDVGCGPGSHLALLDEVRSVGVDLSLGMVREARAHAPAGVADAAHLPFADRGFDRVLALHMLYHCPDIAATVTELRRVLDPSGALLAVTNAPDHLAELRGVRIDVLGGPAPTSVTRFSTDNAAALLGASFADVRLEQFETDLAIPVAAPVVDYIASTKDCDASERAALEAAVQAIIDRDGAFHTRARTGVFICR